MEWIRGEKYAQTSLVTSAFTVAVLVHNKVEHCSIWNPIPLLAGEY
jgi:hypothetical protein